MPHQTNHLFIAAMDVEAEKEALFNDVYDNEHIPFIREVPGVLSVARFQRQELIVIVGGERRTIHIENEPNYAAFYEAGESGGVDQRGLGGMPWKGVDGLGR